MPNTLSTKRDENVSAVFHTSPRTLQELASMRLAFHIWLEKFAEVYARKSSLPYLELTELQFKADMLIGVPVAIREMIESYFPIIAVALNRWLCVHAIKVLHYFIGDLLFKHFDWVVFGGNGTIHFKDSISNILEDDSLDNRSRFEMACVYCVEEKINVLWPLVCDKLCIDDMKFDYNTFMMYYWICRKRGELNRLPLNNYSNSIEHLMIQKCCAHPSYSYWLAIEYFLSLLDPDDRLQQINDLFRSNVIDEYVRYLLPYFDAPAQRHVLNSNGTRILRAFVETRDLFDYAFQSWLYIRDFITGDQFYAEVIQVFVLHRNTNYYRYKKVQVYDYKYIEEMLAEIWSSSPDRLKEFILNFHLLGILHEMSTFRGDLIKNLSRDISFVLAMLSDADIELRKKFWKQNWSKWIEGVSSTHLNRLMDLCLVNTEAIDDFKKTLRKSDLFIKYCDRLAGRGYHNELDDFLSCICSNVQEVSDIKMKLLMVKGV